MFCKRHKVTATTIADGTCTTYTDDDVNGRILSVQYVKDDYVNGVDFTITTAVTGQTVWTQSDVNASATVCPRQATHSTAGAASLYAGSGEPVEDYVFIADERIKIVLAQGGDTKTGTFYITVG